jgi:hypothetical protein
MDLEPQQLAADDIEVSGLGPWLSPHARLRRLAISVAAVLLALLVALAGLPALRQDALALLIAPTPTPTLHSLPGANSFYVFATPPWVTVLVDGRPLDRVPVVDESLATLPPVTPYAPDTPIPTQVPVANGHPVPLRLSHGVHTFEWRGAPFLTQRCTLPVPLPFLYEPRGNDACLFTPFRGSPPGYVVQQRESLATLPSEQRAALRAAIGAGLAAARASAMIQPGEPYLAPGSLPSGSHVVYADSALRATVQFTLAAVTAWSDPCADSSGVQPCRFPGRDCRQLCTTTLPASAAPAGADRMAWTVVAPVQATWEVTTSEGTLLTQRLAEPGPSDSLALLRITWNGASWHAAPLFGHAAGGILGDDPICAPARDWLTGTSAIRSLVPGPVVPTGRLDLGIAYVTGPDPTDGCFVSVDPSSLAFAPVPPIVQPATFLLRFGALLAVNASARQIAPWLPVAGAHEQAIASRLQSLADAGEQRRIAP